MREKYSLPSAQQHVKKDKNAAANLIVWRSARTSTSSKGSFILVKAGVRVPGVVPGVKPFPSGTAENGLDFSNSDGVG